MKQGKAKSMKKRTMLSMLVLAATSYTAMGNHNNDRVEQMSEADRAAFIRTVEFVEVDEEPELGYEVLQYLPDDFDAFKGMIFDMREIHFHDVWDDANQEGEPEVDLLETFGPYVGQ